MAARYITLVLYLIAPMKDSPLYRARSSPEPTARLANGGCERDYAEVWQTGGCAMNVLVLDELWSGVRLCKRLVLFGWHASRTCLFIATY